jgi:hypothetical protein
MDLKAILISPFGWFDVAWTLQYYYYYQVSLDRMGEVASTISLPVSTQVSFPALFTTSAIQGF